MIRHVTGLAPSAWASYLVNNDASGLERHEIEAADAWCRRFAPDGGKPVDCRDAFWSHYHDAWDESPKPADCQWYTFLIVETDVVLDVMIEEHKAGNA